MTAGSRLTRLETTASSMSTTRSTAEVVNFGHKAGRGSMHARGQDAPCINATLTKTIPLPQYHIPKTQSELQLQDDTLAAELRDYCMFRRLVEGMHKRCMDGKKHQQRSSNHHHGNEDRVHDQSKPSKKVTHTAVAMPTKSPSMTNVTSESAGSTTTDDYGNFVTADQDVLTQEFSPTTHDSYAVQKSFAFPYLPDPVTTPTTGRTAEHMPFGTSLSKRAGVSHQESSFEEEADESIFVLDL